ncbi:MAG: bifunctional diaminohydroxyphosphoribosylaminopyrimidine deaminase/5-amino-6-(5-phosphoribosylamino)uracil reductase RibD [Chthoniobacterales bacterium]|nr:bifunctional diaminohydroxyphosphoribosylaminopyrimidine deaminase/5-amino-6-(5-phosphoribosylamino)uracil reductase RibD [Chthoniobacterales bacterium]
MATPSTPPHPQTPTSNVLTNDEKWMQVALELARRGIGTTSPNPPVGAVIVRNNKKLSSGWHKAAGQPHAEIEALRALPPSLSAKGATLYVTLEPCSTHGRTPPCTDAIIRAGFARVVWSMDDPNPKHAGRAKQILEAAGIQTTSGILEEKTTKLLRPWKKFITEGIPWVILKTAMSLDGRIAPKHPQKIISSAASRKDAMRIRAEVDAILIGAETLRKDNPYLTIRGIPAAKQRPQPLRLIWTKDPKNLPSDCHVFNDPFCNRTHILTAPNFPSLLQKIANLGVVSLLIEGGAIVAGQAIDSKLVDEFVIYIAPTLIGGPVPFSRGIGVGSSKDAIQLEQIEYAFFGNDIRIRGLVKK